MATATSLLCLKNCQVSERLRAQDEVAWIKGFKPLVKYDFRKPLIVVREVEERAVYVKRKFSSVDLAKKLTRLGSVVFLPRYCRRTIKGLIIPKKFVDSASLVAQADLFVGAGGTITREAALQGTPAIVILLGFSLRNPDRG